MDNIDKTTETPELQNDGGVPPSATPSDKEALNDNQEPEISSDEKKDVSADEVQDDNTGKNDTSENSDEDRDFRRQIGEKNALIIDALEDNPEKLLQAIEKDSSLAKTAEKKGITAESLKEKITGSAPEPTQSVPSETKPSPLVTENDVNENVNATLSAVQREEVMKKAEVIAKAGVNIDIAIETACKALSFPLKNKEEGKMRGAIPSAGSADIAVSKNVNPADWGKKSFAEKEEYRKSFGEPVF